MKVNGKCVKSMCGIGLCLLVALTAASCKEKSAYSKLLVEDYPDLYTHVFNRQADSILTYTDHPKEHIREQAWKALISTPFTVTDEFVQKVSTANTTAAWMALSSKDINEQQIEKLQELWERQASNRPGLSLVLGQKGNQGSLDFLLRNFENIIGSEYEYEAALAMGRLMMDYEVSELSLNSLVRYAAVREDPQLFRAYFYGLFRSGQGLEPSELQDTLWDTYEWKQDPEIRQYALSILFNSDAQKTLERLALDGISSMNVQVAVELSRRSSELAWSEKLAAVYEALLTHPNPVVNEVTLQVLASKEDKPVGFDSKILEHVVQLETKEKTIRLSGLMALQNAAPYMGMVNEIASGDPYLLNKKLAVFRKVLNADEYLAELKTLSSSEERMEVLFAAQSLQAWWEGLDMDVRNSLATDQVKALVYDFLSQQDRSVTYVTLNFMQESELFNSADYEKISAHFSMYQLPEDIEVFQALGSFLKSEFEEQASAWIADLAAQGNAALNTSLRQQGWDVPEMSIEPQTFRSPDWERLAVLGYEPVWVLETEKGNIKITMDVLSAPATISGIDSLSRNGAYNEIAFHRVVPNFVIQGGDVETGDGFGGPDYVVPTEASDKEYSRGRVGIASAGTDTEGSQYFVMLDWAPHLNGRYTVIGEVEEGMNVVDRILVGDRVIKAYWESESPTD